MIGQTIARQPVRQPLHDGAKSLRAMRKVLIVLLVIALDLQSADPAKLGMDPDQLALISTRMKEFVDEGRIGGAVMLIARPNGIAFSEAVGHRDIEMREPMQVDTIFRVASITKPVTAIGIMMLQEEGRLVIRAPLDRYLPEFRGLRLKNGSEPSRPVTVQDLMTHTSGMVGSAAARSVVGESFGTKTLADVVEVYSQTPLEHEPGAKFLYTAAGFDTLGRIIEVVSGRSYETFMEERIFGPLGMKDSHFFLPPEKEDRFAQFRDSALRMEYSGEGRTVFPAPASGLCSTTNDLGALLQMMMNRGTHNGQRFLSPASVDAMTTNKLPKEASRRYGLGWSVIRPGRAPLSSGNVFYHNGGTGASAWVDRQKDLALVFLIHQDDRNRSYVRAVFRAMATTAVAD